MQMKNMKVDNPASDQAQPTMMSDPSDYPYGLCLRVDEDSIDTLGLTDLPEVGTEIMIQAKAVVRATAISDQEGDQNRSMELQITDLGLEIGKKKDIQEVLYGE